MPEGTPQGPGGDARGEEPERPASYPTEPFGAGSRPTEPLGPPPGPPPGPPGGPPGPPGPPPPWTYQPGPYGAGYQPAPQVDSTATAALIVSIVGFFICFPIAGIIALILSLNAERRIKQSGGRLTGLDQARIAKVIAIIELAIMVLGVVVVALLIAFAGSSSTSSDLSMSALAGAVPAGVRDVAARDLQFEPPAIQVEPGTTVTWHFEDGTVPHDVKADGFASGIRKSGTFTYRFDRPGTYSYRCTLHAGMVGRVIVGQ